MLLDGQKQLAIDTYLANVADLRSTVLHFRKWRPPSYPPFLSGFTEVSWCKVPCLATCICYMLDITFMSKTSLSPKPTSNATYADANRPEALIQTPQIIKHLNALPPPLILKHPPPHRKSLL